MDTVHQTGDRTETVSCMSPDCPCCLGTCDCFICFRNSRIKACLSAVSNHIPALTPAVSVGLIAGVTMSAWGMVSLPRMFAVLPLWLIILLAGFLLGRSSAAGNCLAKTLLTGLVAGFSLGTIPTITALRFMEHALAGETFKFVMYILLWATVETVVASTWFDMGLRASRRIGHLTTRE